MPPPQPPQTLYTSPADVYDLYGTAGGQLRLDDDQLATAQTILLTAAAAQGATSLAISPLSQPLLAGSVLEFGEAGAPAIVEVTLSATAPTGATTLSVNALVSALPVLAQAFDNGVNLATAARLTKASYYGTARVNLYCQSRYDPSELVKSWSVNRWATAIAAQWAGRRRGLVPPASIDSEVEEAVEEMRMVRTSMLNIEDIGTRTSGWPFIVNSTIDLSYDYRRIRIESNQSEGTPTQFAQAVDWNSALFLEI